MMPRAVHSSPGIYLTAEENLGKPQLGDRLRMLCDQPSPQMSSVGENAGEKKEKKDM